MTVVKNILIVLLALAFLGPAVLLICAVALGAVGHAGRAVLGRLRTADADQAVGDAPAWQPPAEPTVPTALIDQWVAECAALGCDDCCGRTPRRPDPWIDFPAEFAAITAALAPDFAHINIQRLEALYLTPRRD